MRKNHLKLVASNKQIKQNLIQKFWNWLNAPRCVEIPIPPFIVTYQEKKTVIQNYLTVKFADYQLTTGEIGLFPVCEAMNEVDRLEKEGKINAYYKLIKKRSKQAR